MATADALDQIKKYGLLSSQATLDLLDIKGTERERLLNQNRPASVTLEKENIGRFVLRDQIPLRDRLLQKCLVDMTLPEWYGLLNERVFMWATRTRVETLLSARAYRGTKHLVLTIDTAALVEKYSDRIRLSPLNSGATLYSPPKRGTFTFSSFEEYSQRNANKTVAEVTINHSIPDFRDFIVHSEIRKAT